MPRELGCEHARARAGRAGSPAWRASSIAWSLLLWAAACGDDTGDRTGERCTSARDCDGLACVAGPTRVLADLEPQPLMCGDGTAGRRPAEACERGAQCASGVCALAGGCVDPCEEAADCPARQRCERVYARAERDGFHPLSACVAMVNLPADTRVEVELRPDGWTGGEDSLVLPPTASRTLLVVEHLDDLSWPVPPAASTCRPPLCAQALQLRDDDETSLFDRAALESDFEGPINPIAVGDYVNPLTVLVPNGPRSQPSAAGYRLRVETKRAGAARLTVLAREPSGARLDLNVFYVGARDLAGEAEPIPELLADALAEVDRIFEPAGVFIGEVRQIEVRGALLEQGSPLPNAEVSQGFAQLKLQYRVYPQLPELFKLSAGAGNVALDVFFVGGLESGGEGDLGGIAGGTPVPFGMHGTAGSGVAIATDILDANAQLLGRTLAHELGHALGLFHTTEVGGQVFDPLSDTPVCAIARDRNGNGLDASECRGAGAENLMFPTSDTSASELTPQQAQQLRAAMLLQ